ncbi:MAG: hypothetical protein J6C40_07660 [Lentisphaeria bacterium]|nr:hypothetical protein [Lentisphaeria bacterium]
MMKKYSRQSGQVLLIGIVMCVIILLAVFVLADVHNTIRAKLKLETAQQAAALAAAEWQRESLNLIGEINLIKASDALLCLTEQLPLERRREITQLNYDRMTEMQARVSFLGPLIGFAAAQQAAKANGMNGFEDLSRLYLAQLTENNNFYFPPGSDGFINNYRWFQPYKSLLETISQNLIAVRPNASTELSLTAYPACLNSYNFYEDIYAHKRNIQQKPVYQNAWMNPLREMCKKPDSYYASPWWDIRFHSSVFGGQSEIYSLYVKREDSVDYTNEKVQEVLRTSPVSENLLPSPETTPELQNVELKWYCYDLPNWDIQAYRDKFMPSEDDSHHSNWFDGDYVLKNKFKTQFQYEGPVAYAETGLRVSHLSHYIRTASKVSTVIGSERVLKSTEQIDLTDRPGAVAKAFGELRGNKPPHTIRMVLPVFHTTSLIPTYLPRPYDFNVLHEPARLELFLMWLAQQSSLTGFPPQGTDFFLTALQYLEDGPGFRYYCWNPNFDADAFNQKWRGQWDDYYEQRNLNPFKYVYDKQDNPTGPGWLQEPRFYGSLWNKKINPGESKSEPCGLCEKPITLFGIGHNIFYAIDHTGKVITNDDPNPVTITPSFGSSKPSSPSGGPIIREEEIDDPPFKPVSFPKPPPKKL